jgi:hypothetical protein
VLCVPYVQPPSCFHVFARADPCKAAGAFHRYRASTPKRMKSLLWDERSLGPSGTSVEVAKWWFESLTGRSSSHVSIVQMSAGIPMLQSVRVSV